MASMRAKAERKRVRKEKKTKKKSKPEGGLSDRGYLIFCRAICVIHKRANTATFSRMQRAFTKWAFHARHDISVDKGKLSGAQQSELRSNRAKVISAFEQHGVVTTEFNAHEKQYMEKISSIRHSCGIKVVSLSINLRYLNHLRRGFDLWHIYSQNHQKITKAKKERDNISKEFEKINAKMEYIKGIEETNSRLQLSLLVKLAVLRLRAHTIITSMSATRERNLNMRQTIYDEIIKVKESLAEYEEMEKKLLISSSAHRGDYFSRLDNTKSQVAAALETQFHLKKDFDENLQRQFQKEEEEESKAQEATGFSGSLADREITKLY